MTIEIIKRRERKTIKTYALNYTSLETPGSGFSFKCDKFGDLLTNTMHPEGWDSLQWCEDNADKFNDPTLTTYEHSYVDPARGRCICGSEVVLSDPLDNTCLYCGRNYNMCGQEVLHSHDPRVEEPYEYDY